MVASSTYSISVPKDKPRASRDIINPGFLFFRGAKAMIKRYDDGLRLDNNMRHMYSFIAPPA